MTTCDVVSVFVIYMCLYPEGSGAILFLAVFVVGCCTVFIMETVRRFFLMIVI